MGFCLGCDFMKKMKERSWESEKKLWINFYYGDQDAWRALTASSCSFVALLIWLKSDLITAQCTSINEVDLTLLHVYILSQIHYFNISFCNCIVCQCAFVYINKIPSKAWQSRKKLWKVQFHKALKKVLCSMGFAYS